MREAERVAHGSGLLSHAARRAGTGRIDAIAPEPQAGGGAHRSRRIGIVGNPRSHAYRPLSGQVKPGQATPGRAKPGGAPILEIAEPASLEALRATLSRFAANGVDLLVVQGGDGTFREVLTLLPDCYGDAPPELAILATGNTNLAARVFGRVAPGPRGLAGLAAAAQQGRLRRTSCRTLRVDWQGQQGRDPVRGLFLGACLYADGKRLADARIHRHGVHNGLAVAAAVLSALAGALGRRDGTLRRGTWRRMVAGGEAPREGNGFVFLATTLDRLMLGFWPFGGENGDAEGGAIRWLDMDAPPRRLASVLLHMLLRRSTATTRGHRNGRSNRIALRLDGAFVLDGEFFEPGPDGVVLSDGGSVTIVSA